MPIPKTAVQVHAEMTEKLDKREAGWRPGDQLPTWEQLADQFKTSLGTIARVMQRLNAEGRVVGVPGRGTWVAESEA